MSIKKPIVNYSGKLKELNSGDSISIGVQSKSFVISSPTVPANSSSPVWRTSVAITIQAIHVLCIGGTSITGNLWVYDVNGGSGVSVDSSDIVGLAGANTNDDESLANPSVIANAYIGWHTTSISGTPTRVIITFDYILS